MRENNFALLLSIIVWLPCLSFAMKRVSYIDNGMEKLNTFWSKLAFSSLFIIFIIILIEFAGVAIEFIGIALQKFSEFLALPVLRLLGLN